MNFLVLSTPMYFGRDYQVNIHGAAGPGKPAPPRRRRKGMQQPVRLATIRLPTARRKRTLSPKGSFGPSVPPGK
jgi:hypothetical protein